MLRHHHAVGVTRGGGASAGASGASGVSGASGEGRSGDYAPLGVFLATRADRGGSTVTLTFAHVEQLLGRALPPSSRQHRQWWENDRGHVQARAWLAAGWRSGPVDVAAQWVTFTKDATGTGDST